MRLLTQPDAPRYDRALVLTTPAGEGPARQLIADMEGRVGQAALRALPVNDPSDHAALFAALGPALAGLDPDAAVDVVLSAGTPQAQTMWVILVAAGLLPVPPERVRMLQVIPPAFVPDPHPHPVREVTLDIEGFPRIRALRAELGALRARDALGRSMIGESPPMVALRRRIARAAPAPLPVLIRGETGTGKELVARAARRQRAAGPAGGRELRGAGSGRARQRALRPRGGRLHRRRRPPAGALRAGPRGHPLPGRGG